MTRLAGTESGSSVLGGIGDFVADNNHYAGVGLGALGLLAGDEEKDTVFARPETREVRAYQTKVKGPITGATRNLAEKKIKYNEELLQLRERASV